MHLFFWGLTHLFPFYFHFPRHPSLRFHYLTVVLSVWNIQFNHRPLLSMFKACEWLLLDLLLYVSSRWFTNIVFSSFWCFCSLPFSAFSYFRPLAICWGFCSVSIRVILASCDKSISRFHRPTTTGICYIRSASSRYCAEIIVVLSR